jgi:glycosyltransferase involved in cell wall biosynthesis
MPGLDLFPIGGYKVIYEMANRLAADGFNVAIILPCFLSTAKKTSLKRCCGALYYYAKAILKIKKCPWFNLDERVKRIYVFSDYNIKIPEGAFVCATAIETAFALNKINSKTGFKKYKNLYYIQGFENWVFSDAEVYESYRLPFTKVAISRWLCEKISNPPAALNGGGEEKAVLVPNGFNFSEFSLQSPIENRDANVVCMLYHGAPVKDCACLIEALSLVKKEFPALRVNVFGTPGRPDFLPPWFMYFQKPDNITHNRIYNEAAVFAAASRIEGFGLTVGEAMICGCAVACTECPGFKDMIIHNKTGLMSPVGDAAALAVNIKKLMTDGVLRETLAKAGNEYIKKFTWDASYKIFKSVLADVDSAAVYPPVR